MIDFLIDFWSSPEAMAALAGARLDRTVRGPPRPKLFAKAKSDLKSSDMKIEDLKISRYDMKI